MRENSQGCKNNSMLTNRPHAGLFEKESNAHAVGGASLIKFGKDLEAFRQKKDQSTQRKDGRPGSLVD